MLQIKGLWKRLGEFVLGELDLEVEPGDYFVLLGPSGSGKTLLLEMIAGFLHPDGGRIILEERDITAMCIQDRQVGYLCQGDTLFPHLSVRGNIAYGLRRRKMPVGLMEERVEEVAREIGAFHLLERRIEGLSGGERQRVALARALVMNPACLLLDEPLTGMDTALCQDILMLLRRLNRSGGTFLHVTHDHTEALAVATKVAIMEQGRIVQQGAPMEVVNNPRSLFAARLAGIKNFFPLTSAPVEDRDGMVQIIIKDGLQLAVPGSILPQGEPPGFLRLEERLITLKPSGAGPSLEGGGDYPGTVTDLVPQVDGTWEVTVNIGVPVVAVVGPGECPWNPGDRVQVSWPRKAVKVLGKGATHQRGHLPKNPGMNREN